MRLYVIARSDSDEAISMGRHACERAKATGIATAANNAASQ